MKFNNLTYFTSFHILRPDWGRPYIVYSAQKKGIFFPIVCHNIVALGYQQYFEQNGSTSGGKYDEKGIITVERDVEGVDV